MRQINDLLAKVCPDNGSCVLPPSSHHYQAAEVAPPISVEVKIYKAGWKELHTTTCCACL